MALTNDDLQAIAQLMNQATEPIYGRLDKIDGRLDKLDGRVDKLEGRLGKVESRLDKVELQVADLISGQMELKKEIKEINLKVSNTYDLALEAWGKTTENRKWLEKVEAAN